MTDTIFNPIFNDTCTFLKTSAETQGSFSDMMVTLGPDGGTPLHKHKGFVETFIALEGNLGLIVDGKKIILSPGEKVAVHKGQAHRFFNPGDNMVKFHLRFTPGHTGAENMLRIMYGLARDGKTNKKGIPKSLMELAIAGEMGDSSLAGLPAVLAPILKVMAFRARKKGVDKALLEKYCKKSITTFKMII